MARQKEAARLAALQEARVIRLLEVLGPVLEDTKANIEKKQARTYEEMQAELNEADQVHHPLPFAPTSPLPSPPKAISIQLLLSLFRQQ